jgi:hypothetical protein
MLAEMNGRDDEALTHLGQAIHSRTNGFTLVNYEMGKIYLRHNRPADAIAITRSALFGDIDGPNLYVTRTDLHDLMARSFAQLGQRDSAAFHYRAVAKALAPADPRFRPQLDSARAWLSSH